MNFLDWLFAFIGRMLAVPELHALIMALGAGLASCYLLTLPLPAWTPVRVAAFYGRLVTFAVVFGVAVYLIPSPRMAVWAFTVAVFTPLAYEAAAAAIFHRWPWLKPKALMTADEMAVHVAA
jgi:hypothetical protein